MKLYKTKLGRIYNFIKNEGKLERWDIVKILPLTHKDGLTLTIPDNPYGKYVGQLGIVVGIDYTKKYYIFGVKFEDGKTFDFKLKELEKIQPENPLRYKKLNIEY